MADMLNSNVPNIPINLIKQKDRDSSRHWMGVVYNHSDPSKHHGLNGYDFYGDLLDDAIADYLGNEVKYYCRGSEVCPTSGTPHLQMYFIFKEKQSLRMIRKKFTDWLGFPCTVAFVPADKNVKACIQYCGKDGTDFVEGGQQPPGAGKRTDIDAVISAVKNGSTLSDIANNHPSMFIKCGGGISKWMTQISKGRDFKTEVFWVHGPTGTGKSRWVMDNVDRDDLYLKSGSTKWWCGYADQKNVLWDDFRPSKDVPFEFLLRLLDRFPMQVEGKGTVMNFAPERIFITTPQDPMKTFAHWEFLGQENMEQLTRRISRVVTFEHIQFTGIPPSPGSFVLCPNIWTTNKSIAINSPPLQKKRMRNEMMDTELNNDIINIDTEI